MWIMVLILHSNLLFVSTLASVYATWFPELKFELDPCSTPLDPIGTGTIDLT